MSCVRSSDGPVVVTGTSGFIGSHVVASLMRRGYEVRAAIRRAPAYQAANVIFHAFSHQPRTALETTREEPPCQAHFPESK